MLQVLGWIRHEDQIPHLQKLISAALPFAGCSLMGTEPSASWSLGRIQVWQLGRTARQTMARLRDF